MIDQSREGEGGTLPPAAATEPTLLAVLEVLREIRDGIAAIRHELADTTLVADGPIRGVDRHAPDVMFEPNDPRNPQTLKDFLALIKTEVRHSDDCERLCYDRPWSTRLGLEWNAFDDLDGNGLIFGSDFIFAEPYESWPNLLSSLMAEEDYWGWEGEKMTFQQYHDGLPPSAHKEFVRRWLALGVVDTPG